MYAAPFITAVVRALLLAGNHIGFSCPIHFSSVASRFALFLAFRSGRAPFKFIRREDFNVGQQSIGRDRVECLLQTQRQFIGRETRRCDGEKDRCEPVPSFYAHSAAAISTAKRAYNYLLSSDWLAGSFFFSCDLMPIFFRNGWIDCFRPRNFSTEIATSRESPAS